MLDLAAAMCGFTEQPPCYSTCGEPKNCTHMMDMWNGGCASNCTGFDPVWSATAEAMGCQLCNGVLCRPTETCNANTSCIRTCEDNEEQMVGIWQPNCTAGAALGLCNDTFAAAFNARPGWFRSVCCESCGGKLVRGGTEPQTPQERATKALVACEKRLCGDTKSAADHASHDFNFQPSAIDPK